MVQILNSIIRSIDYKIYWRIEDTMNSELDKNDSSPLFTGDSLLLANDWGKYKTNKPALKMWNFKRRIITLRYKIITKCYNWSYLIADYFNKKRD